jgi:hypothetical protein
LVYSSTHTGTLVNDRNADGVINYKDVYSMVTEVATVKNTFAETWYHTKFGHATPKLGASAAEAVNLVFSKEASCIIYDSPVLQNLSGQDGKIQMIGEVFYNSGYGFAMPKTSPYTNIFTQAVLAAREDGSFQSYKTKWFLAFQTQTTGKPVPTGVNYLLTSIFVSVGLVILVALILLLVSKVACLQCACCPAVGHHGDKDEQHGEQEPEIEGK